METNQIVKRFIELDKKKAEVKKFYDEYNEAVNQLAEAIKVGGHFQDEEGTVYQVAEAKGKFVHFEKFTVNRTRREGEARGDLSLKKAEELGYDLG